MNIYKLLLISIIAIQNLPAMAKENKGFVLPSNIYKLSPSEVQTAEAKSFRGRVLEYDFINLKEVSLLNNRVYFNGICMHSAYVISDIKIDYTIKSMPNVLIEIKKASEATRKANLSANINFSVEIDNNTSLISLGKKATPIWFKEYAQ